MPNADGQEALIGKLSLGELESVAQTGKAVRVDSVAIACFGVQKLHDYRGIAWALLARGYPKHFVSIHRAAVEVLREAPYPRIETYADPMVPESGRWLAMLGFTLETAYKPFIFPDGRGAAEWVLVK